MHALCSVSDATRDALLSLFRQRFSQRIATATTEGSPPGAELSTANGMPPAFEPRPEPFHAIGR